MFRIRWFAWVLTFCIFAAGIQTPVLSANAVHVELSSPSALLLDAHSGQVLYAKNADERREPASLTKIATLAIVMRALRDGKTALNDMVTASPFATSFGGSQIWLEPGEQMSVQDLLYAVAVGSANDGSVALAEHISGSEKKFVQEMNELMRHLGAKNTHFSNSHGLPASNHFTTARDLAILSRYIVNHYPELLKYTSRWEYFLREGSGKRLWLVNTNRGLKNYEGMDGLKTGWTTSAGFNLVATAKRGDTRLIGVVMGASTSTERFTDMYRLLNEGFANFETVIVAEAGQPITEVSVSEGVNDKVSVVARDDTAITVKKGDAEDVEKTLIVPERLTAPIAKGDKVGSIVVVKDGEQLAEVDLVASEHVARAPIWQLFFRFAQQMWPLGNR